MISPHSAYIICPPRPTDIATLARMTGKDFSGPTPVIRTPTPVVKQPETESTDVVHTNAPTKPTSKRKKKAAQSTDDVEVLGNLSDIDDDVMDLAIAEGLHF